MKVWCASLSVCERERKKKQLKSNSSRFSSHETKKKQVNAILFDCCHTQHKRNTHNQRKREKQPPIICVCAVLSLLCFYPCVLSVLYLIQHTAPYFTPRVPSPPLP
uniref:(northern house mosquito) hypothetical protein n=1 Tax=Culex pipiens TaxID=7175 RepID=A0A8D8MUD8_CULPI